MGGDVLNTTVKTPRLRQICQKGHDVAFAMLQLVEISGNEQLRTDSRHLHRKREPEASASAAAKSSGRLGFAVTICYLGPGLNLLITRFRIASSKIYTLLCRLCRYCSIVASSISSTRESNNGSDGCDEGS